MPQHCRRDRRGRRPRAALAPPPSDTPGGARPHSPAAALGAAVARAPHREQTRHPLLWGEAPRCGPGAHTHPMLTESPPPSVLRAGCLLAACWPWPLGRSSITWTPVRTQRGGGEPGRLHVEAHLGPRGPAQAQRQAPCGAWAGPETPAAHVAKSPGTVWETQRTGIGEQRPLSMTCKSGFIPAPNTHRLICQALPQIHILSLKSQRQPETTAVVSKGPASATIRGSDLPSPSAAPTPWIPRASAQARPGAKTLGARNGAQEPLSQAQPCAAPQNKPWERK